MSERKDIIDRLTQFIALTGLSVAQFERKAALSNGYVRNFKGVFGNGRLESICEGFPELNKNWLLTGKGEMKKNRTRASLAQYITGSNVQNNTDEAIGIQVNAQTEIKPDGNTETNETIDFEAFDIGELAEAIELAKATIMSLREDLAQANIRAEKAESLNARLATIIENLTAKNS